MLRAGDEPILGYKLIEFLGRGQFGQVWKSTAPGGGLAALKFLDLSGRQGWKEFRGIQRVKQIRHAHLMPITALWLLDEDGNVLGDTVDEVFQQQRQVTSTLAPGARETAEPRSLIVAQLLGDKSLTDRMEECQQAGQAGIPREELLPYMQEAAKGIDFLNAATHDLGEGLFAVQHCDIKPDNMLLAGDSVLVCDFGVAQVLADGEDETKATGMVGSLAYMSPECAARQPSKTSDQYSLAISYYELLTGELPFREQNQMAVLDAHRTGQLTFDKVTPAEREVLKRATSVDHTKRFPSCAAMVNALRPAVTAPGKGSNKSRRSLVPVVVAVGLAIAMGFLALAVLRPEGKPASTARTYTVKVVPPDAEVFIEGERLEPNADNQLTFEREPTAMIQLTASKPPDFKTEQLVVDLRNYFDNPTISVRLRPSAQKWADEALRKLSAGRSEEPVPSYVKAIELDDDYRQLPAPTLLMQPASATAEAIRLANQLQINHSGTKLVAGCSDGAVLVWEIAPTLSTSHRQLYKFPRQLQSLAVGDRFAAAADFEGSVVAVSLQSDSVELPVGTATGMIELALSPDDRTLLVSSDAEEVKVVRAYTIEAGRVGAPVIVATHDEAICCLDLLSGGAEFLTGSWDDSVKRWRLDEPNKGREVALLSGDVLCLARNEEWLAVGGDGRLPNAGLSDPDYQVLLTSLINGQQLPLPGGHDDAITHVAVHSNGNWLASASADGKIRCWSLSDGKALARRVKDQHERAVNALAFHPTDDWLFSAADDGKVVLWDLQAGESSLVLDQFNGSALNLVVSADGQWLFTAGEDGTVRAIDLVRCWLIKKACAELKKQPLPPPKPASTVRA